MHWQQNGWLHNGLTREPNRLEYTVSSLQLAGSIEGDAQTNHLATLLFRHYEPLYELDLGARIAESVFSHCPLGIVRADFYGTIRDVNPAMLTMFNLSRERTIGQNVTIFMPPALRGSHPHFLEAFRRKIAVKPSYSSKIVNNERSLTTQTWDGRTLSISLGVRVIDGALIAFIRDREALVLGSEYRKAEIKNSFPPMLARKYFRSRVPDSKEGLQIAVSGKAVMCIDLVSSAEKFAGYSAREHYDVINAFLSVLDGIVSTFQGVTIKHTGDGLLAIFDPIYKEEKFATFATLCSLSCLAKSREWSQSPPVPLKRPVDNFFSIRIGISTGDFIVAVLGKTEHLTDIDVIGQTVVTACRLQTATRTDTIAIDPETYRLGKVATKTLLKDHFAEVPIAEGSLKGLSLPTLYHAGVEGLTADVKARIQEKGATLVDEAARYEERLLSLRAE